MGYANCGEDSKGRPIGYNFSAICDEPECREKIDRGLAYVCGHMHGEDEYSCEKYFCSNHKSNWVEDCSGNLTTICNQCYKDLLESGDFKEDPIEGCLKHISIPHLRRIK